MNLRDPRGREIAYELVKQADIVAENNRADVVVKWGLDYERVRALKPDIIYISSQGFGRGGPYENYSSFGPNLPAVAGIIYLWNHPDNTSPVGGSLNHPDHIAGKQAAVAVLAALDYRRRTGKGQFIDLSQIEMGAALIGEELLEYTINGRVAQPMGNRSRYSAPQGVYRCQGEDRWLALTVTTEKEWDGMRRAMGNPSWADDPRFATLVGRRRNHDDLDACIESWTIERDPFDAMLALQREGVPAGVVENAEDQVLHDSHIMQRGGIIALDHPAHDGLGEKLYPGQPIRLSRTPALPSVPSPTIGQHTAEICRDLLGMSDAEIQRLSEERVLGY